MTLRILGGEFKGHPLKSPSGAQTRPTTSLLRKAVFDILQTEIVDAQFLDLFAGSGAMGLEALSRGALHATFVENHPNALRALKANIAALQCTSRATIYPIDVVAALKKLKQPFDIIYADPPYHSPSLYHTLLTQLDASSLLSPHGRLLVETPLNMQLPQLDRRSVIQQRRYGDSILNEYYICYS